MIEEKSKKEIVELRGPLYQAAIDAIGPEETEGAIQIWEKLIGVLEIGFFFIASSRI